MCNLKKKCCSVTGRGEAAKLTHLLESVSLKKNIWIKIIKKYVMNSWISFLNFSMHRDCIESY